MAQTIVARRVLFAVKPLRPKAQPLRALGLDRESTAKQGTITP